MTFTPLLFTSRLLFSSLFVLTCSALVDGVWAADTAEAPSIQQPKYDAELAQRLGADDYGMKLYIFVTLLTGEADALITDQAERARLFAGHFANMSKLAAEGHLVLAGPFVDAKPKRGLFILNTGSMEEASQWVKADPAVQAGIFTFELSQYYGSAALMQVNGIHQTIQKTAVK
jgi:uncharacterized protein